jgi:hypothetical protein
MQSGQQYSNRVWARRCPALALASALMSVVTVQALDVALSGTAILIQFLPAASATEVRPLSVVLQNAQQNVVFQPVT